MANDDAARGADPASGAGRLMAGSMVSPEIANSLALRLSASRLVELWEDLGSPPGAVLLLPADTTVFFLDDSAFLSSLKRAGVTCKLDIAFIKANTSCLSIAAAGALLPFVTQLRSSLCFSVGKRSPSSVFSELPPTSLPLCFSLWVIENLYMVFPNSVKERVSNKGIFKRLYKTHKMLLPK